MVRHRKLRAVQRDDVGIVAGGQLAIAGEHVGDRQRQHVGVCFLGLFAPRLEGLAVHHLRAHAPVEEREQRIVVGEHVAAARLVAQARDLLEELPVLRVEGAARLVLAAHQRVIEEHEARLGRRDGRVVDALVARDGEPEERRVLLDRCACRSLRPVGLGVASLQEMGRGLHEPFRLDLRHHARKELRGLHQLECHDPCRRFSRERRRRVDIEPGLFRAHIDTIFGIPGSYFG